MLKSDNIATNALITNNVAKDIIGRFSQIVYNYFSNI